MLKYIGVEKAISFVNTDDQSSQQYFHYITETDSLDIGRFHVLGPGLDNRLFPADE